MEKQVRKEMTAGPGAIFRVVAMDGHGQVKHVRRGNAAFCEELRKCWELMHPELRVFIQAPQAEQRERYNVNLVRNGSWHSELMEGSRKACQEFIKKYQCECEGEWLLMLKNA